MRKQFPVKLAVHRKSLKNNTPARLQLVEIIVFFQNLSRPVISWITTKSNPIVLNPVMFFDLEASLGFSTDFEIGHMIN